MDAGRCGSLTRPPVPFGVPRPLAPAAARTRASSVVVGVRPEHLMVSAQASDVGGGGFPATLALAAPLGHDTLPPPEAGGARITVRGAPGARPPVGSAMRVSVNPDRLHLFEAES